MYCYVNVLFHKYTIRLHWKMHSVIDIKPYSFNYNLFDDEEYGFKYVLQS